MYRYRAMILARFTQKMTIEAAENPSIFPILLKANLARGKYQRLFSKFLLKISYRTLRNLLVETDTAISSESLSIINLGHLQDLH